MKVNGYHWVCQAPTMTKKLNVIILWWCFFTNPFHFIEMTNINIYLNISIYTSEMTVSYTCSEMTECLVNYQFKSCFVKNKDDRNFTWNVPSLKSINKALSDFSHCRRYILVFWVSCSLIISPPCMKNKDKQHINTTTSCTTWSLDQNVKSLTSRPVTILKLNTNIRVETKSTLTSIKFSSM